MRWLLGAAAVVTCACQAPVPCVTLDRSELDFGVVEPGGRNTMNVTATADTTTVLHVQASPLDAPFEVDARIMPVVPRDIENPGPPEPALIAFAFAPGRADGLLHFAQTVVRQEACADQPVTVRGTGGGGLTLPAVLDFGITPVGVAAHQQLRLTNSRREPLTVSLTVPAPFVASASDVTIPAIGSTLVDLAVTLQSAAPFDRDLQVVVTLPRPDVEHVSLRVQGVP